MKRFALVALAVCGLSSAWLRAQGLDDRVRDTVTALTAKPAPPELSAWCNRLIEPEKRAEADDTEARMVLHGLSMRAGSAPALRSALQAAFVQVLAGDRPTGVKLFVLEQLQFVADGGALPALLPALRDGSLCDRACRVAVDVGGPQAANVVRQAMPGSAGAVRLALVQALGELGDAQAVPALLQEATAADRDLRLAALRGLAASGAPQGGPVLLAATRDASRYVRSQADAAYLAFLVRQVAAGRADEAVTQAAAYAGSRAGDEHIQAAVMDVYARAATEAAADAVLTGMLSGSERVRQSARLALRRLPAERSAPKLARRLETTPVELRPGLLQALGELGVTGALPAVKACMRSDDAATRRAAILAFGVLAGGDAVTELTGLLAAGRDGVPAAAADALAGLRQPGVGARLAELAGAAPPAARALLLGLLARRLDLAQTPALFAFLKDTEPDVRLAAWRALETLAGADHLGTLVEAILASPEAKEQKAGVAAFAASCRRVARPDVAGPLLGDGLARADAPRRAILVTAAPAIGGATALTAVAKQVRDPDSDLRNAAVRALADWPDDAALPTLTEVVTQAKEEAPYVLAFRGIIRLLGASNEPAVTLLPRYADVMKLARRADERRLVISGIGRTQDRAALAALRPYLKDAELQAEAATGVIQIAKAVGGDDCVGALKETIAVVTDEKLKQRAREALAEVAKYAGCVITWEISGPYTDNDKGLTQLHTIAFLPETDPAKAVWRKAAGEADGRLDLNREFRGNNRCAYLRCQVLVPADTSAVLAVGSDDGVNVWLNGTVVHDKNVPRPFTWGEDTIPVKLAKGPNQLLLKVTQGGGDWMANARLRAPDGTLLDGLNVDVGGTWRAVSPAPAPAVKPAAPATPAAPAAKPAAAPAVPAAPTAPPAPTPAAKPAATAPPAPLPDLLTANGAPSAEQLGWRMSIQCWSFNKDTFFDAVDRAVAMGVKCLEMFPGQRIDGEHDWQTNQNMPPEALKAVQDKLRATGVRVVNFGVTGIPGDEAGRRKLFDWARTMGIETLCAEPDPAALTGLEPLCQEYGINIALHNHPQPSRYWNPQTVLDACKGLSPRFGACADIGHWMRSGIIPVDAIKLLQGRIVTFHFKDLNEMGKGAHDVHWGTGKADIPAVLRLLKQQGFRGVLSSEYEHNWGKNTADIAACTRNLEALAREILLEEDGAWQVLFNQRDLDAWQNGSGQPPAAGWVIEDGSLALRGKGGGYIWTRERFGDFVLDLEYETTGNSGLFFRTDKPQDPVQTGIEMQVDKAETGGIHGAGALYDLLAPATKAARPGWNHVRLAAKGSLIIIVLNDQPIVQADLEAWTTPGLNPDGSRNKFTTALKDFKREGHIGFQDHGAAVRYRNIRIRKL